MDGYRDLGEMMLHGGARSRWFDKSFQIIMCANGRSAVNFEHAWGDGVAVLRYCNEVWQEAKDIPVEPPAADAARASPERLQWDLTPELTAAVDAAGQRFDEWLERMTTDIALIPEVDAGKVRALKVGPDGFMQVSMQLAHYRVHGHLVPSYESANHAAFKHGRTECIRPATIQVLRFCEAMSSSSFSPAERAQLLRDAIKKHGEATKDALMGQGVDRHLFGLQKMAEIAAGCSDEEHEKVFTRERTRPRHKSDELNAFFSTAAHKKWQKIIVSTSTLDSVALDGGGFGPINDDCYAIGYAMRKSDCGFIVSTYRKDGAQMAEALMSSIRDMYALLKEHAPKKESE